MSYPDQLFHEILNKLLLLSSKSSPKHLITSCVKLDIRFLEGFDKVKWSIPFCDFQSLRELTSERWRFTSSVVTTGKALWNSGVHIKLKISGWGKTCLLAGLTGSTSCYLLQLPVAKKWWKACMQWSFSGITPQHTMLKFSAMACLCFYGPQSKPMRHSNKPKSMFVTYFPSNISLGPQYVFSPSAIICDVDVAIIGKIAGFLIFKLQNAIIFYIYVELSVICWILMSNKSGKLYTSAHSSFWDKIWFTNCGYQHTTNKLKRIGRTLLSTLLGITLPRSQCLQEVTYAKIVVVIDRQFPTNQSYFYHYCPPNFMHVTH